MVDHNDTGLINAIEHDLLKAAQEFKAGEMSVDAYHRILEKLTARAATLKQHPSV
jgi:hypothetical protein